MAVVLMGIASWNKKKQTNMNDEHTALFQMASSKNASFSAAYFKLRSHIINLDGERQRGGLDR